MPVLRTHFQFVCSSAAGQENLYGPHGRARDPVLALAARRDDSSPPASPATQCRLHNSTPENTLDDRYHGIAAGFEAQDELFVDVFLYSHSQPPDRISLGVDVSNAEIH